MENEWVTECLWLQGASTISCAVLIDTRKTNQLTFRRRRSANFICVTTRHRKLRFSMHCTFLYWLDCGAKSVKIAIHPREEKRVKIHNCWDCDWCWMQWNVKQHEHSTLWTFAKNVSCLLINWPEVPLSLNVMEKLHCAWLLPLLHSQDSLSLLTFLSLSWYIFTHTSFWKYETIVSLSSQPPLTDERNPIFPTQHFHLRFVQSDLTGK